MAFSAPVLMVVFVMAGAVMQQYAPEAKSIGGVWKHFQMKRATRHSSPP